MKKYTDEERAAAKAKRTEIMLKARTRMEAGEIPDNALKLDGTKYSGFNQCAIASQEGMGGVYGGFASFIKLGRSVKKGEHGYVIAAPLMKIGKGEDGKTDHSEDECRGMTTCVVFHIDQTEPVGAKA